MLFNYTYVPHGMDKMQAFIDFIFTEVWCNAPFNKDFHFDVFNAMPDLKEIMESFYYSDTTGGDFFYGGVERLHGLFAELSAAEIRQLKDWYSASNEIENICKDINHANLVRYADIKTQYPDLHDELSLFFKGLYSQNLLSLAIIKEKVGDIDDHYESFMTVNKVGKCPFCGINDVLGPYHEKREAYDHYLPKSLYPFNSINFSNLAPACHHCNSSYKTVKDPSHSPKDPVGQIHRRKAFYPYCTTGHKIDIEIDLSDSNVDDLTPSKVTIDYGPLAIKDEIDSWRDVYGIDERYTAKCCGDSDGKYWLEQVLDEANQNGRSPADFLSTLRRHRDRFPMADCNFLKLPFLEACEKTGLFE